MPFLCKMLKLELVFVATALTSRSDIGITFWHHGRCRHQQCSEPRYTLSLGNPAISVDPDPVSKYLSLLLLLKKPTDLDLHCLPLSM